jgi:hypothetical protein
MRFTIHRSRFTFPLLALALLTAGCSTAPKRSTIQYSAPRVDPVRTKISAAQVHAKAEAAAGIAVAGAIAKAQSLVGRDSVEPENIPQLQEALGEASGQANSLLTENYGLQDSLDEAQANIETLEVIVNNQTASLNTCIDDKNILLDQVRDLKAAAVIHDRKYHRLKLAVCLLLAAGVTFLAVKLGLLKLLRMLSLLGPWGMAGAAAAAIALPAGVFAFLWFKL